MKTHISTQIRLSYLALTLTVVMASCIHNDLPYPRVNANITSISAVGQSRSAQIDSVDRVVTLFMPEDANIYQVTIDRYTLTHDARITDGSLAEPLDLSLPYQLTVSLYQDYQWTIEAHQDIERYFTVDGQIGTSVIDVDNHTVSAQISKRVPIDQVKVLSCKLAPACADVSPQLDGRTVDFSQPLTVTVVNYGHSQQWTIIVEHTDTPLTTIRADGWTNVGWVYCQGEQGKQCGVQYRIKGDTQWIDAPSDWIIVDGGDYHARLVGLTAETTYEARAVSGKDYGETIEFTTGANRQLPNGNFDQWWLDGKVWCPWPQDGYQFWDTGNKGAATLGQSNSVPTDDTVDGSGQAAMLQTRFIGFGMIGKLGAGNIFVGQYLRTDGTNGVLSFGKEFTERPTRLRGYWKYHTAPISSATAGYEELKGRPDTCQVYIALIDSEQPLEIRTNPSNRSLFDPNESYVVAYASIQSGDDIPAYTPFDIELQYRSTSRVPRYIVLTCSASKYGDFFTGGNGATLFVDDFELLYDY